MAHPFYIGGLPRSRTAWWAVATTTANSICHHEPGPGIGAYEDARALWEAPSDLSVGISDAGLGLHLRRILDEIGPKTLIVVRDSEAVLASIARYTGLSAEAARPLANQLLDVLAVVDHPLIMRVPFEALHSEAVVRDCMAWLGVEPLNLPQLMHMNIQSDLSHNLARVSEAA